MEEEIAVGQGEGAFWSTEFPLHVPQAASNRVSIRHNFFGGMKVVVDGVRAKQGSQRAQYLIPTHSGAEFELTLRPGFSGTSPTVVASTNAVPVGRRIRSLEWLWVGLPLLLPASAILGQGGFFEILLGFLAFAVNVRVFINDGFTVGQRFLTSFGSLLLFAGCYFAVSGALALLLA